MARGTQTIEIKPGLLRPRWASIERAGDRICVRCTACSFVDADRVHRLHLLIAGVMTPEVRTVELDLRLAAAADTKLLAVLVAAMQAAARCGVRLVVRSGPHLDRWIRLCRLEGLFAESLRCGNADSRR